MERHSLDKLERRARKALRHATFSALKATTDRAQKRHERRASEARKALRGMERDAFAWGADPG